MSSLSQKNRYSETPSGANTYYTPTSTPSNTFEKGRVGSAADEGGYLSGPSPKPSPANADVEAEAEEETSEHFAPPQYGQLDPHPSPSLSAVANREAGGFNPYIAYGADAGQRTSQYIAPTVTDDADDIEPTPRPRAEAVVEPTPRGNDNSKISDMEAKRLSKFVKEEGDADDKFLKSALKDLDRIKKLWKKATKTESSAQSKHAKAVRKELKLNKKYLAARAKHDIAVTDLKSKADRLESLREDTRIQANLRQQKSQEIDQLRTQKENDDRARLAKLAALKSRTA